jgi:hypothetical protein
MQDIPRPLECNSSVRLTASDVEGLVLLLVRWTQVRFSSLREVILTEVLLLPQSLHANGRVVA